MQDLLGLVALHQAPETLEVGHPIKGRVLDVNKQDGIVDLSLKVILSHALCCNPIFLMGAWWCSFGLKAILTKAMLRVQAGLCKSPKKAAKATEKMQPGDKVDGVVELIKDEYVVVSIPKVCMVGFWTRRVGLDWKTRSRPINCIP